MMCDTSYLKGTRVCYKIFCRKQLTFAACRRCKIANYDVINLLSDYLLLNSVIVCNHKRVHVVCEIGHFSKSNWTNALRTSIQQTRSGRLVTQGVLQLISILRALGDDATVNYRPPTMSSPPRTPAFNDHAGTPPADMVIHDDAFILYLIVSAPPYCLCRREHATESCSTCRSLLSNTVMSATMNLHESTAAAWYSRWPHVYCEIY